jgi:hypothetical protein
MRFGGSTASLNGAAMKLKIGTKVKSAISACSAELEFPLFTLVFLFPAAHLPFLRSYSSGQHSLSNEIR